MVEHHQNREGTGPITAALNFSVPRGKRSSTEYSSPCMA